jgi:hypothetical protein
MFRAAFYKGTRPGIAGLYNRLIRFWEPGDYSHVELIFSDGLSGSSSLIDGGVRLKPIDFDDGKWDFIDLPASFEEKARQWFENHIGCKYDLLGQFHFVLSPVKGQNDKYWCNEAVLYALGAPAPWRYGPNATFDLLRFLTR